MVTFLTQLLLAIRSRFARRARLEAENLLLRQQLVVLRRKSPKRVRLWNIDRLLLVWLYRLYPSRAMRIRDHPTAPRSPWQNGHVERLIGSIRRESLDHLIVFDEAQLRRVLKNYTSYYNQVRTHLSLHKDAPDFRRPQKLGPIASLSILGGLHHQYVRV